MRMDALGIRQRALLTLFFESLRYTTWRARADCEYRRLANTDSGGYPP